MANNFKKTPKLAQIRKDHEIRNANISHKENLSALEKLAILVTKKVGTMGFFFIVLTWTVCWLGWNIFGPASMRFDPMPAFVLWLFISNMVQLFLMPLIMIGQNLHGRHAEIRAEADFEINVKAEREIEAIFMHLENQNRILLKLLEESENRNKMIENPVRKTKINIVR